MKPASKKRIKALKEEIISEFCASSSIHGIRYLDSAERTTCERFWWIIVFFLSIAGCGTMIYKAYTKWDQSPIIVTFAEKATPLQEIKFPAITICPTTQISAKKLNLTAEIDALMNESEYFESKNNTLIVDQLKVIAQICNFYRSKSLDKFNGIGDYNVVNIIKNLSLDRDSLITMCDYDGDECTPLMKETITEYGLCNTFNMFSQEAMFREEQLHNDYAYIKDWERTGKIRPVNAHGPGILHSMTMFLHTNISEIHYNCLLESQGYLITLHESDEYPTMFKRRFLVPFNHEVNIYVKPQITKTSLSAQGYHHDKRQCFLENERHLQFFKIYKQDNCEIECMANVTLALCGCVRFSMPRTPQTEVCSYDNLDCMDEAASVVVPPFSTKFSKISEYLDCDENTSNRAKRAACVASKCRCLPSCTSVQFDVEVTQSTTDWNMMLKPFGIDPIHSVFSRITVSFKESHFITSQRTELFGIVDFLANCGGLLGLFMGFSILSLLEICYFITIHPFSLWKRSKKESRPEKEDSNALLGLTVKGGEKS